jgi:hypothetical protein
MVQWIKKVFRWFRELFCKQDLPPAGARLDKADPSGNAWVDDE